MLRALIGGSGVLHVAPMVEPRMSKFRRFLLHPAAVTGLWVRVIGRRRGWYAHLAGAGPQVEEGNASRRLADHLHPNLGPVSQQLAVLVQRLHSTTDTAIIAFGSVSITQWGVCVRRACRNLSLLFIARSLLALGVGHHEVSTPL